MKLDHLFDACFKHSAGGFGTLDTLTPVDGTKRGPISLHDAIVETKELSKDTAEEKVATAEDTAPSPGSERHERAMALLKNRRLLSRAAVDMKRLGHVGEFAAKKLGFVCAASARSGKPIQPSTHAQSAAGKNTLWNTVPKS